MTLSEALLTKTSHKFMVAVLLVYVVSLISLVGDLSKLEAGILAGVGAGYGFFNKWCDHRRDRGAPE